MRIASSLTNRIFIASTLLATLSLGFAFLFVNARATAEVEADLERGLAEAATIVDENHATRSDLFTRMARVVADTPKFKAAVETKDPPTVQRLAPEALELIKADVLVMTDPNGKVLGSAGADAASLAIPKSDPEDVEEISTFLPHDRGVLQVVSVPIFVMGGEPTQVFGRLTVGFFMDGSLARQLRGLTDSEIAFAADGRVLASSLGSESLSALGAVLEASSPTPIRFGDDEYVALARPMHQGEGEGGPITLTLRSRTERLRFLNTLQAGLVGALIVTLMLATILSYAVARTVTRPLAAVTGAMGDLSATGDLTRKVPVRSRAWDDEDARLLASAFNTLTESIARFQREAAQKERLSSLGRLSTVIAHEIRNPLMIIRATLTSLRRERVSEADRLDAAADIDEETTRLNHLVSDVLDFAKPIRFELAPANVNDVCRASATAAWVGHDSSEVQLDLEADMPMAVTDAERLRTALVNILTNARHAIHAVAAARAGSDGASATREHARAGNDAPEGGIAVASEPGVLLKTRYAAGRVSVIVRDHGTGITPEDLAHVFDPYFTTRRKGTGLGLPIAKNIVEGLGGVITVSSRVGDGTEIRLDLPLSATEGLT
jgi:signal transduction histidine kinase